MVNSRLVSTFDLFPFGQIKPKKRTQQMADRQWFQEFWKCYTDKLGDYAQICMHVNLYLIDWVAKKQQQLS